MDLIPLDFVEELLINIFAICNFCTRDFQPYQQISGVFGSCASRLQTGIYSKNLNISNGAFESVCYLNVNFQGGIEVNPISKKYQVKKNVNFNAPRNRIPDVDEGLKRQLDDFLLEPGMLRLTLHTSFRCNNSWIKLFSSWKNLQSINVTMHCTVDESLYQFLLELANQEQLVNLTFFSSGYNTREINLLCRLWQQKQFKWLYVAKWNRELNDRIMTLVSENRKEYAGKRVKWWTKVGLPDESFKNLGRYDSHTVRFGNDFTTIDYAYIYGDDKQTDAEILRYAHSTDVRFL
ncbi:hypothetical protein L596_017497 [Steinernema carpocapsae]|uniref:F-box associated domain-containing protein n=1 Tax=Steinernema carpocapsae TaxID=34508 RepID=A0A4U5N287_STECR|nr:hypothetical protein L596_017497 [Steinernema carpocapsae]